MVESGRAEWPEVVVSSATFVAHVAARLPAEAFASPEALRTELEATRAGDMWIACACTHGVSNAVPAIDARLFPDLRTAVDRVKGLGDRASDLLQSLRRDLFVGEEARQPRIADYNGRGDLRGWLRVTAVRAALKVLRNDKREISSDGALLESEATAADPEMAYVKELYRAQFRTAFQLALDSLEDRDKALLKQHVVDGLSIDRIGDLYQVHRATAARWVQKAKETLLERTRDRFRETVKVGDTECASILRLVGSQLDGTIRRRLEAIDK
jgi:RNA polymerase sigma-70 factor (ECF subfamily)